MYVYVRTYVAYIPHGEFLYVSGVHSVGAGSLTVCESVRERAGKAVGERERRDEKERAEKEREREKGCEREKEKTRWWLRPVANQNAESWLTMCQA